jgi:hypothetical protein
VSDSFETEITPEPSDEDREAVLAAVRETLRREAELARPSPWRLAGRTDQRAGILDVGRAVGDTSRWRLSSRMPRGGRPFTGMNGRGDSK